MIIPPKHPAYVLDPDFRTSSEEICSKPDYKLYEKDPEKGALSRARVARHYSSAPWSSSVYIIMSFTAKEQIGRYVFHCHILKHEDTGLMAPMEVWAPV